MYLVFARMPGESYRRRLRSYVCLTSLERLLRPFWVGFFLTVYAFGSNWSGYGLKQDVALSACVEPYI